MTPDRMCIGVDDYGRPDYPGIKPWADKVDQSGQWRKPRRISREHCFLSKGVSATLHCNSETSDVGLYLAPSPHS